MTHPNDTIPYGFCHCGCGGKTAPSRRYERQRGWVYGEPNLFISRHNLKVGSKAYWVEEDRGYSTPCHIWQGTTTRGYAMVWDASAGIMRYLHRVNAEKHFGSIPDEMDVDHLCRQRSCVNVDHLEVVTKAVNIQRGAASKLTPELVREIRRRAEHTSLTQLAKEHGVTTHCIWAVVHRKTWKNIH